MVILESKTPNHRISTSLPSTGNRSEDYNLKMFIVIEDTNGASHSDELIVKVHLWIIWAGLDVFLFLFFFFFLTRKKLITNTCYFNYEKIYIYMAKNKLNLSRKKTKQNKQTNIRLDVFVFVLNVFGGFFVRFMY